ncbi:MAG TPA: hypothetical protein VLJ59_03445 [Mycobacteriales bacterium]|nr:hypothetical protein [Mycobacteriales bacterium]
MEHIGDLAELLALELVDHAAAAAGEVVSGLSYRGLAGVSSFTLHLRYRPSVLLIETWDRDPLPPRVRPNDVVAADGLYLVPMLAERWHYYHPPAGGKFVWCELVIPLPDQRWLPRRKPPHHIAERPPMAITDLALLRRVRDGLLRP